MNDLRPYCAVLAAAALAACGSSAGPGSTEVELRTMTPLKTHYPDLVAGLDVRPQTTLIVSVDLQNYIEADDSEIAAMRRDALARWRSAWSAAHPHAHSVLHVRFIDFIGRKVGNETTKV
jgi:hypothetical protein